MILELPYPPSMLNPNRKNGRHWAATKKIKDKYYRDCFYIAKTAPASREFEIVFCPPDKRRRDIDNCIAAIKPLIDALAAAWKIDDSDFIITFPRKFFEPVKNGKVLIKI